MEKIELQGFNNLTKTLSFNIYDICYAKSEEAQKAYVEYIDEAYNAERLTGILKDVASIIDAEILNIARQDYDPVGASVTMLVAEMDFEDQSALSAAEAESKLEQPGPLPDSVVAHLNKSHLTVHTYPESDPDQGICTFRADIEVSTCGKISPLKTLNYLIHSFESDILTLDYRVRGFTRDVRGRKHFIDHAIHSIQNFIEPDTLARYNAIDVNIFQEKTFHTKMMLKDFDLNSYLFGVEQADLCVQHLEKIEGCLRREMAEIYYGLNMD